METFWKDKEELEQTGRSLSKRQISNVVRDSKLIGDKQTYMLSRQNVFYTGEEVLNFSGLLTHLVEEDRRIQQIGVEEELNRLLGSSPADQQPVELGRLVDQLIDTKQQPYLQRLFQIYNQT